MASTAGYAQKCAYTISGHVLDRLYKQPLSEVLVYIADDTARAGMDTGLLAHRHILAYQGTRTDTSGYFSLGEVCAGRYIISYEAPGYKTVSFVIDIPGNKSLDISLSADSHALNEIIVNGQKELVKDLHTVTAIELKGTALLETRGQSLGESLKSLPGLNSIQTGPSLSKPVIHGLHSNRVLILNNGVRQEGQQWGSEHAPEIDPFVSEDITVIKGAASIRYGSDAIAGVVLLDPPAMLQIPGLRGDVYLVGASNGRMGTFSADLEGMIGKGFLSRLTWRVQGTLKGAGNFSTADYYLVNTGMQEKDFSVSAAYKVKGWESNLFFSSYSTKIGIYAGSHVGNINDLYAAFTRARPLTPDSFYYRIDRSYQTVNHNILKISEIKQFEGTSRIEANFSYQADLRNEYDIDRPYSTNPAVLNAPQISFRLNTIMADFIYVKDQGQGFSSSLGVVGSTQGNRYQGLRYLIPNFRNYGGGAFAIEKWQRDRLVLESGLRYDYKWFQVYREDLSALKIFTSTYYYKNPTATIGATYRFNPSFHANINFGTAWRAPSINELFIEGIHLSAASYEIGDSSLRSERSYNTSLSLNYHTRLFDVIADLYDNEINHFIFASPTLQPVTLITGTYPSFKYVQTDASLHGIDLSGQLNVLRSVSIYSKSSIVRGWNKNIDDWLIFMPADRFQNGVSLHADSIGKHIKAPHISFENLTVLRQTRVPPKSDYVAPPSGYSIFNANIGCSIPHGKQALSLDIGIQNFTNVAYRDYLNRFRYYADDLGVNFIIRAKFSF